MQSELPKVYNPGKLNKKITARWLKAGVFTAVPDERPPERRFVVMMPLPNVTGALHMGHAMDNVMQDLLVRWHRMLGHNTLWQPGTDHAGIATQAVVEKRLFELEGKTRHDLGRKGLVERIWAWKDEYQERIVRQQQEMGCSADWDRQRFTMDPVCGSAVREAFFRLFSDRLIYHGDRLVNWDCQLQTAVSDDEVYHDTVKGHFWYLRYPVIDPEPGEPDCVVVATTRPETILGDAAVACHPAPRRALEECIAEQESKIGKTPLREREAVESELERLKERVRTILPRLELLVSMAASGRKVLLPLMDREIPLILDIWAKPELGTGSVKITPAHDPNDYEVWQRHSEELDLINILSPDGSLNSNAGPYVGLDRFVAREHVLEDLQARDLIEAIEDYDVEIGHSDRSKTPIEPYLSKQWFVRMGDSEQGVRFGRGTSHEFMASGLAQAAIDAVGGVWKTATGRFLVFHPERYTSSYVSWLSEKRDWCISRQLWWGHRIPVWTAQCDDQDELGKIMAGLARLAEDATADLKVWLADRSGAQHDPSSIPEAQDGFEVQVCIRNSGGEEKYAGVLEALGLKQDPDVLDTWFSSALWPFSTLGWPDPENAPIDQGQTPLGPVGGWESSFSYYYPGSCLVTSRDIITLWVARMLIMGLYLHGEVPFTDCFIHAKILDGRGVTMSKSKGNGIDPLDIMEQYGVDAMRYLLCDMETGMQDVRLSVQAVCPSCSSEVELSEARHGRTIFTYLCPFCEAEFDILGTMPEIPSSRIISDRFEVGRNFCNKLWNAARYTVMNLCQSAFRPLAEDDLRSEDRWMLSRLSRAIREISGHLEAYRPSTALSAARDIFWGVFCDWYLELVKPRMRDAELAVVAGQVLATVLDLILRLLHPFLPFITEQLWEYLNSRAPERGIDCELQAGELCALASWPEPRPAWEDAELESEFEAIMRIIGRFRELRSRYGVSQGKLLPGAVKTKDQVDFCIARYEAMIKNMARLSELDYGKQVERPPNAAAQISGDLEIFLGDVLDPAKEKARLERQKSKIVKQLESGRKKLASESFVGKAPDSVVRAERARVKDLENQLALVGKNLATLD